MSGRCAVALDLRASNMTAMQAKIEKLKQFRETEKAAQSKELLEVEGHLGAIALKLRSNKRPPYTPPAEIDIGVLLNNWETLEKANADRDQYLEQELARYILCRYLRVIF